MSVIRTKNRIQFAEDFVLNNKKIGIGTDDPQATLDVAGDINATGIITASRLSAGLYENDVRFLQDVFIDGNISIAGTQATVDTTTLRIQDKDIILGFTTNQDGEEVSSEVTATGGGIALASTEGTPIAQVGLVGIDTIPPTYKKILWFSSGSFSGFNTDAWIFNYGISIGNTMNVPDGTRLAAGNVLISHDDITAVGNVNATGIITGNTADFNSYTDLNVTGVSTLGGDLSVNGNLDVAGISTFNDTVTFNPDGLLVGTISSTTQKFGGIVTWPELQSTNSNADLSTPLTFEKVNGAGTGWVSVDSTIQTKTSGKYYIEVTLNDFQTGGWIQLGVRNNGTTSGNPNLEPLNYSQDIGNFTNEYGLWQQSASGPNTTIIKGGVELITSGGTEQVGFSAAFQTGDIIGILLDLDNNTLAFSLNGAIGNSVPVESGLNYKYAVSHFGEQESTTTNFGETPFTYTPPAGYQGLFETSPYVEVEQDGLDFVGVSTFADDVTIGGDLNVLGNILTGLDITGDLDLSGNLNVAGLSTFADDTKIGTGGTVATFDVSTGNVGIGSTQPIGKLDIGGQVNIPTTLESVVNTTGAVEFGGTNDRLEVQDNAEFEFGSGEFTIEAWVYLDSLDAFNYICTKWDGGAPASGREFVFRINNSNPELLYSDGTSVPAISANNNTITAGAWYHVAVVRDVNTLKFFVDGVLQGITGNDDFTGVTIPSTTNDLSIATLTDSGGTGFDGKISNLRIVKGTAVYTSNFTVPTPDLDVIAGTSLLCCQSSSDATQEATGKTISAFFGATATTGFSYTEYLTVENNLNVSGIITTKNLTVTNVIGLSTFSPSVDIRNLSGPKALDIYGLVDTDVFTHPNGDRIGDFDTNSGPQSDEVFTELLAGGFAVVQLPEQRLSVTRVGGNVIAAYKTFTTVVGVTYTLSCEVEGVFTSGNPRVSVTDATDGPQPYTGTVLGTADGNVNNRVAISYTFTATSTSSSLNLGITDFTREFYVYDLSITAPLETNTISFGSSGISTFKDTAVFDSTGSIQIPVGTTAERPGIAVTGQIRYNTNNSSFEGYGPGGAWGSLGGVKDVDGDTYILAETSAGSDEDTLYFYTGGELTGTISTTNGITGDGENIRSVYAPKAALASYASHSETSHSAYDISGISTYTNTSVVVGSVLGSSYNYGKDLACSADGKILIVGADEAHVGGASDIGAVYVHERIGIGNSFREVGIATAGGAVQAFSRFGQTVACSADGRTFVVGAPFDEIGSNPSASGAAYVFDILGDTISQVGILTGTYAVDSSDYFGSVVAMSADGKTIVVGAPDDEIPPASASAGVVYVYERVGNTITEIAQLEQETGQDGADRFGSSVAISADGNHIYVGAIGDEFAGSATGTGVVHAFDRIGNTFNFVDTITASLGTLANQVNFGWSIDCSANGENIIVGARNYEIGATANTGVAFVYDRVGNTFNEVDILTGSTATDNNNYFGDYVEMSADGETIVVASYGSNGDAFVFSRKGNEFVEICNLKASSVFAADDYCDSIAMSADGKIIYLGASNSDFDTTNAGAVYVWDQVRETYVYSDTSGNIGIGSTIPTEKLDVDGNVVISGTILAANLTNVAVAETFIASPGVAYTMDSYTLATDNLKTAEYTIHIENGSTIQSQKLLVMQNGTTAFSQEYAIMFDPDPLVSIASTLNAGVVSIEMTPETGVLGLTTYRYTRQSII